MNAAYENRAFRAFCLGLLAALVLSAASTFAITQLATITVGHNPGPVALNPSAHLVYVVNQSANTVSVLDSERLTVKKVIAVGGAPVAIAANPVANMVYVANSGSGTISAITSTKAAVTWTVGGKPIALVADSALNKLFVIDSSLNRVRILNSTTGAVLATLSTGSQPTAIALNIATHSVFVACTGSSGSIVVIDGNKNLILTTVASIPAGVTSISVDPVTNIVVVASPTAPSTGAIAVIDAGKGYTVEDIPGDTGAKPTATGYDAGGLFFVADNGDGNIYFALGDGQFTLGNDYQTHFNGFTSLAVNPSTNQMGAVDPSADTVFVIDLLNPLFASVYHELTTGLTPIGMAFDPLTSRFFVTNSGDNTVSVFDVSPHSMVPAYEGNFSNSDIDRNFLDINPATGTIYTLRLGNLYAINEAQAAAGSTGLGNNSAGVTAIPVGSIYSTAVAANPATNKIYVGDNVGLFYSVNGATNIAKMVSAIPSTANIMSIAVNSAADQVLAWDQSSNNLFVLDSATDALLKTIPLGSISATGFVVADPAKDLAYVAGGSLFFVDPTAGAVLSTIPLKDSPAGVAFNAAAGRFYVASNNDLFVIDTNLKSLIVDFKPPFPPAAVGVNPLTGNYYVAADDGGTGTAHVYIYNGTTNALILDLSSATYPELARAIDIKVNPLTNTVYVGKEDQASTGIAAIDGLTNVVSTVTPNTFDLAAHVLGVDIGSSALAGAGYSYTSLWLPTSDTSNTQSVPIAVTIQGMKDLNTIASKPLFRTHSTQPSFKISATSNFSENASALVPKHGFYQVDGWQGTWTAVNLTATAGAVTSQATVKLPVLSTGQHLLYVYAGTGDVSTVQDSNTGANSPVISPIGFVVFTVEK